MHAGMSMTHAEIVNTAVVCKVKTKERHKWDDTHEHAVCWQSCCGQYMPAFSCIVTCVHFFAHAYTHSCIQARMKWKA